MSIICEAAAEAVVVAVVGVAVVVMETKVAGEAMTPTAVMADMGAMTTEVVMGVITEVGVAHKVDMGAVEPGGNKEVAMESKAEAAVTPAITHTAN